MNLSIKKGIYKHYKGGKYEVLFIAKQTETDEELVVYKSMKDAVIWARPIKHFLAKVKNDGNKISRFSFIQDSAVDDYEDMYKRALADYDNLLKRTAKEKEDFATYANEQLLHEIIPVYDNLKISLKHASGDSDASGWVDGVKYIVKQFRDVLLQLGVEEVEAEGVDFDPMIMEAISGQGAKVAEVVKPGYKLKGKIIIPAKVIVGE